MNRNFKTIYQKARNNTDLTQEVAAEILNVSPRSLAAYELGQTVPHGDIVKDMIDIYKTSWLGYEHLRLSTKLGQQVLPPINTRDLAQSVLSLQKETADVENVKSYMIEIASNSKVDSHQTDRWSEVVKEVLEMAGAALSVVYTK